jgi:RNA polymerase sigma factor (sigma-70 family)
MQAPVRPARATEADLAASALAGSAWAWDEIVRRHSRRVLLSLLARGTPLEAAEDLVQETWARLLSQQRAGRLRMLELPGLAIAQAGWLAREAVRTQARRVAILGRAAPVGDGEEPDPGADPERHVIGRERLVMIGRVLDGCPPRSREVFLAVYGPGGRGHAEVARELRLSVQRVRQILCEVRARVREQERRLEEGERR